MREMRLYHTETFRLSSEERHEAILGKGKNVNQLLVFVHGFNGTAVGSWNNFSSFLCQYGKLGQTDMVFYGYNSLERGRGAGGFSSDFLTFLKEEIEKRSNRSRLDQKVRERRLEQRNYEKITIVAHSLGAIVVRKALLGAKADNVTWLSKIQMMLFAPAHLGAKIEKLIFGILDIVMVTRILGGITKHNWPVLSDLERESDLLKKLETMSLYYLNKGEGDFTKARMVVHSYKDGIVTNDRFCEDPQQIDIKNSTHKSVCKPTDNYDQPVNYLISLI